MTQEYMTIGCYVGETVYNGPNSPHKVTIKKFMIVCNGDDRYTNFAMMGGGQLNN